MSATFYSLQLFHLQNKPPSPLLQTHLFKRLLILFRGSLQRASSIAPGDNSDSIGMHESLRKRLSDCQMRQQQPGCLDSPKCYQLLARAVIRRRRPLFETGR